MGDPFTFIRTSLTWTKERVSAYANPSSCRVSTLTSCECADLQFCSSLSLSRLSWKHAFCCLRSISCGGQGKVLFVTVLLLVGLPALPVSSTHVVCCVARDCSTIFQRTTLGCSGFLLSPCELFQEPMAMTQAEVTWKPSGEVMWKCFCKDVATYIRV